MGNPTPSQSPTFGTSAISRCARANTCRMHSIRATEAAIREVGHPRFFLTERGFHGRFYCALQAQ